MEDSRIEITPLGLSRVSGQWRQQARKVNDSSAQAETRCYKKPDEDRQLEGGADLLCQRDIQARLQRREGGHSDKQRPGLESKRREEERVVRGIPGRGRGPERSPTRRKALGLPPAGSGAQTF